MTFALLLLCLHLRTRCYSNAKGDSSLPLRLLTLASSKATTLLQRSLLLITVNLLNALRKLPLAQKLLLLALSLRVLKSERLSNTYLTLICAALRPIS
jgi:hypothetical protein